MTTSTPAEPASHPLDRFAVEGKSAVITGASGALGAGIENIGGDLDAATGKRCTFAAFPWRWTEGDGSGVRVVAILDRNGSYRISRDEGT